VALLWSVGPLCALLVVAGLIAQSGVAFTPAIIVIFFLIKGLPLLRHIKNFRLAAAGSGQT